MEKRWTPHRKCDFQKGSIDVLTIVFFFLFCLKVFNRKLPIDAWKTSNQSRCMLQWREAVFHGTMDCCCSCQRRTSTDKSFYLVVWSKSRKEGIVEAVQASGYVNVLGTG